MNSTEPHHRSAIVEEIRELEQVAGEGTSAATPAILYADMFVLCALVGLVMLAFALLAYRLAS
jgi:hypothetical protein